MCSQESSSQASTEDTKEPVAAAAVVATPATTPNTSVQVSTEKTPAKPSTSHSYNAAKKDDIKIVPTVLPVLGYSAASQNLYQPLDGVQLFAGAQAQPTTFPTYQQGVSRARSRTATRRILKMLTIFLYFGH